MLAVNTFHHFESCPKRFVHVISFHVIQSPFLKLKRNHDNFDKKIQKFMFVLQCHINLYSLHLCGFF